MSTRISETIDSRKFHAELFEHNGFHVIRGALGNQDVAALRESLHADVDEHMYGKSIADACNKVPTAREFATSDRLVELVRQVRDDARFLQVCDVQISHNRDSWHRDSACRTFGSADWDETGAVYLVFKVILYLEAGNAGLAVFPGSHRHRVKPVRDHLEDFSVILPDEEINEKLTDHKSSRQYILGANPGDAIIFDERLLHCGRRYTESGQVTDSFTSPKTTLAYVFGGDDRHSWRFYSFFRYMRPELKYSAFDDSFVEDLREKEILPNFYGQDLFNEFPEEQASITGK